MNAPDLLSVRADWLGEEASHLASAVNGQFEFLFIIAMGLVLGSFLLVSIILLRRRDANVAAVASSGMGASILFAMTGGAIAAFVFAGGLTVYVDAVVPPARARTIEAVGSSEGWSFVYGPDVATPELHVSTQEATLLKLSTDDVVRRLAIPALKLSRTVWPDQPAQAWFAATSVGEYQLVGSDLPLAAIDSTTPRVVVHDPASFEAWLSSVSNVLDRLPPVEAGFVLVQRNGCLVCHSTDGAAGTAPTFLGILARSRNFVDGSSAVGDSAYVRQSILDPQSQIVEGFQPVMPNFTGKLGDPEIAAILAWFESLVSEGGEGR